MVFHSVPVLENPRDTKNGTFQVGRNADQNLHAELDTLENERKARLEAIRFSGYKFLKPPGVGKTLKVMHEEEVYMREMSYTSSNAVTNFDSHHAHMSTNPRSGTDRDSGFSRSDTMGFQVEAPIEPSFESDIAPGEEDVSSFAGMSDQDDQDDQDGRMDVSEDENLHSGPAIDMNASFPSMYYRS